MSKRPVRKLGAVQPSPAEVEYAREVRELQARLDAMQSPEVVERVAAALHDFNERDLGGSALPFEALSPSGKKYRREQARIALGAAVGGTKP